MVPQEQGGRIAPPVAFYSDSPAGGIASVRRCKR
jgi:hypothetical protein